MARGDISSGEKALALATKRAIEAAGGLERGADETSIGRSQLSRCGSVNERDSISIRDAVTIDLLGQRQEGHPFIVRAICRQLGGVFVELPEPQDDAGGMALTVVELAGELGDLSDSVRGALCERGEAGTEISRRENEDIRAEIHRMQETLAAMDRQLLSAIGEN
ncbi:phage regulatory CII family protein [Sphingobium yanoikuyae]|uniref:phage regulatory CII family protein n=1 Tax=Sphingobium yanoikuyae TaxID=13690 RepID=UPI002431917D|nr:phage regulatory CII family protein [Sphingobium yanoikuyae]